MQLKKFQETFKETMFQPASNLQASSSDFDGMFKDSDIALHERLKVYHNNVVGSISAALCATFPLLNNLVGEDFLKPMARAFIFDNPPNIGCLQMYGAGFGYFIKGYDPAQSLPYLPDIATLEFALNHAYYATDDAPMAADTLAGIEPETLSDIVINLRESATLISSKYPLIDIRDFCLNSEIATPDMKTEQPCFILVIRQELEVNIISLAEDEFTILTLLNDGISLGIAVEITLSEFPDFDFTAFLQRQIKLETFSNNWR